WTMIGWGALAGVAIVLIDEALGRARRLRLPPLAVGIGIYLPMAVTLPVVVGAVIGHRYDRWADRRADPEAARRMGVLAATGLIVGESLFGVAFAGIVAATGSDAPLAVVADFETPALFLGLAAFAALLALLYRFTARRAGVAQPLPR
ncbi:MAG TPA: OPT/YSL family transporter, partial [Sphingomonas sp.]